MTEPNETAQDEPQLDAFERWVRDFYGLAELTGEKDDLLAPIRESPPYKNLKQCWRAAQAASANRLSAILQRIKAIEPFDYGPMRAALMDIRSIAEGASEPTTSTQPIDVSKLRVVQSNKAWFLWRDTAEHGRDGRVWETIGPIDVHPLPQPLDAAVIERIAKCVFDEYADGCDDTCREEHLAEVKKVITEALAGTEVER